MGLAADALIGHWPLGGDGDTVDLGTSPVSRVGDVSFEATGARFGGKGHLRVDLDPDLTRGDYTVSALVAVDEPVGGSIGDIVARFDPAKRQGFSLGFTHGTSTGNQRNDRNMVFGLDAGSEPRWEPEGRPGDAQYVGALAVHEGALYAGTYEPGSGGRGRVYRYDGPGGWIDTAAPVRANFVQSLAAMGEALYAGTTRMIGAGSGLPESPNTAPGGQVLRWTRSRGWETCGQLDGADSVVGMAVLDDQLFATPAHSEGVFRLSGQDGWEPLGTPGRRLIALGAFRGSLYGAGNDHLSVDQAMEMTRAGMVVPPRSTEGGGGMFRWEGGRSWRCVGLQPDTTQVYSIAVHEGDMFIATWPTGTVFRYLADDAWHSEGRLGAETEVMGMVSHNGMLYAGTVPLAQVYRYDGPGRWTLTGRLDHTPDVLYRRASSMAVYRGRLFCGTLPSGQVWSLQAGAAVSHDRWLAPGWHHVAATRRGDGLALYVDGTLAAEAGGAAALGSSVDAPLVLGGGPRGDFVGRMRDVRIHAQAHDAGEVARAAEEARQTTMTAP